MESKINLQKEILTRVRSNLLSQILFLLFIFGYNLHSHKFHITYFFLFFIHFLMTIFRFKISGKIIELISQKKDYNFRSFSFINLIYSISWSLFLTIPFFIFQIKDHQANLFVFLIASIVVSAVGTLSLSRFHFLSFVIPQMTSLLTYFIISYEEKVIFIFQIAFIGLFINYLLTQQKNNLSNWVEINKQKDDQVNLVNSFPGFVAIFEKNNFILKNDLFSKLVMSDQNILNIVNKKIKECLSEPEIHFEIEIKKETFLILLSNNGNGNFVITGLNVQSQKEKEQIIKDQKALIEQSAKLSALGEVSGGIAHEINNPLAIISLSGQSILLEASKNGSLDKIKNSATKINSMVDRITYIIKSLRTFSRDASNDPLEKVKIEDIIEDTFNFCQSKFKNNEITIHKNIEKDLFVMARKTELSQVFFNILNNSFEAVVKNNSMTKEIYFTSKSSNGNILVEIQDSGEGIPESIRDKIFQPFFTTKEIGKGTGLGLSIANSVIKDHGGNIYFDFKKEKTTLVIELKKA